MIVVIDGPAGSGKSSTALAVAQKLKIQYLDSGALYRAATHLFLKSEESVPLFFETLYKSHFSFYFEDEFKVFVNDLDLTQIIRTPEISSKVSTVAAMVEVRDFVNKLMHKAIPSDIYIADGRDLGTAVFPNAERKFFMVANPSTRAKRRHQELLAKGIDISYQEVCDDIQHRDKIDSTREKDPLKQAEDAVLIDTSEYSFDEQVDIIAEQVRETIQQNKL
jgi:cytidylate kinase